MGQGGDKIIYPELSYQIIGIVFEVFNDLGYGYLEKYYQKALEVAFKSSGVEFKAQCPYRIMYKNEIIGKNFIDFIIENKIILEIKKGNRFSKRYFDQVNSYLKVTGMKLAILVHFTSDGVKFKRILNIKK